MVVLRGGRCWCRYGSRPHSQAVQAVAAQLVTHVALRCRGSAPIRSLAKSGHLGSPPNLHLPVLWPRPVKTLSLAPQIKPQNPFLSFGRFLSSALLSHPFPSIPYPIRQLHPSNFIKMADDAQVSKQPV